MARKPEFENALQERPLLGKPGPFQIVETDGRGELDNPIAAPRRRYDCTNYEGCLALAAALNWDSFTCRGCNGEIDSTLCWRAHQIAKKDRVADQICELPALEMHEAVNELPPPDGSSPSPGSSDKVLYLSRKRTASVK